MYKAIKYTVLPLIMLLIGVVAAAKNTPGIPPVDTPQANAGKAVAWTASQAGSALRELDRRSPDRMLRSLVQPDGIIDFRPDRLAGIHDNSIPKIMAPGKIPVNRIPGGSNLCGFIAYNELDLDLGIYRLPIAANQKLDILRDASGLMSSFRGGASSDDYYVMSYYGTTIQNGVNLCLTAIFDKKDWSLLAETGDYGQFERICSDMTYDPVSDRFYGCFLNHTQSKWVLGYMQVDHNSPAATISKVVQVCDLEVSLNGLAADASGVLWGIRNDNGELVTINRKTGAMTTIGQTGLNPEYNGSLAWDDANGLLYWAATYNDASAAGGIATSFLTVNPRTAALTHVTDYKHGAAQTGGLYVEFTAPALSPGAFTNLEVSFIGESLSGSISFDAPSALANGTAASDELDYTLSIVKDNGYIALNEQRKCSYGAKGITVPLTMKSAGYYTITLQAKNDVGIGYPLSRTLYIGPDQPRSVENIAIDCTGANLILTWDAATSTVHGGYFDPMKVRYDVTVTMVDGNGVLTELSPQSVTIPQAIWNIEETPDLRGFQASVTAVFDVSEGEATTTPYTWFGALQSPFVQSMTARVDGWTTLTVGGTSSSWNKVNESRGKGWAIPYVWGTTNDAWLFSPAIAMEAGKYYVMSFKAWSPVVKQSLHVWIGRQPIVDAMATLLTDTSVKDHTEMNSPQIVSMGFECKESGVYYLGFHNDTKSDTWTNVPNMWINDVTCEQSPDNAPAAPGLVIDYDKTGNVSAQITISAPGLTYGGASLTRLDKVVIECNGTQVRQWENVDAGSDMKFEYQGQSAGTYIFVAKAILDGIEGVPTISGVFLGMSKPVDPEWVDVAEHTDELGTVDVTWATVGKSTNGQDIASEAVSYNVMNIMSNSYIEKGVTEQPFSVKVCNPDDQSSLLVSVNAVTSAGESSTYGTFSRQSIMHVGKAYTLPFRETFADGYVIHSWSVVNQHSAYDRCSIINTRDALNDVDANGDGYCLQAFVPYADSKASLYSGKIEVPADARNPVIGFAVYRANYGADDNNQNTLYVSIIGDKSSATLKPVCCADQKFGWQYYYYDVSMLKGQIVNIMLTWHTIGYTSHYVDDIHFFDAYANDLAVDGIGVPAQVNPGENMKVNVFVTNTGTSPVTRGSAIVELRRGMDGALIASRDVPKLSPFQSTTVSFLDKLNNSYDADVDFHATVVYADDENLSNNASSAVVRLNLPELPVPQNLVGARNEDGFASLTWSEPDLSPVIKEHEIGFESSTQASMTDLEGFKTIDVDGNEVYGELGLTGPQGFTSFPHSTLAHSGGWMVVSPCNADGAPKEDWLISPKLSGNAQTLSFFVRTNWNAYEHFTVLTSTQGDDRADFTATVLEMTTRSNDWENIEIDLPEGTTYFAIVSKADNTSDLIYLMLDDFKFEGADANEGLIVSGYNTYRDNTMIDKDVQSTSWDDLTGNSGPHFYRVTASYADERGESAPSGEIFLFIRGSGLDGVNVSTGKVYSTPGMICVEGADGCDVTVADVGGIVMARFASASAYESVRLPQGVYIVTINKTSVKIVVR